MQIGEIAKRLNTPIRAIRYILEQGLVPKGAEKSPGRGEHRDLDIHQTFWLAMVIVLKHSGVNTPLAAAIADKLFVRLAFASRAAEYHQEYPPFQWGVDSGGDADETRWYGEVGDRVIVRLAVELPGEKLKVTPWEPLGERRPRIDASEPLVTIRLDLTTLGWLLSHSLE